jgi:TolB-like protein
MKRYFLTCAALAMFGPVAVLAQDKEIKALASDLADILARTPSKTVAVVDLTDLQGNVTELGRFLAEELSVALASTDKGIEVIDRTHLKALLQEHKLAATGVIDPATARRLGEIAGVQVLVTGTITPFGDSVRTSVKALDSATAKIITASSTDVPRTKAIDELLLRSVAPATIPTATNGVSDAAPTPTQRAAQSDSTGKTTFAGKVTSFEWKNPQAIVHLDVIDNRGNANNWTVELPSPNGLMRRGWTRESIREGDRVTVTCSKPAASISSVASIIGGLTGGSVANQCSASAVTLADGHSFSF